MLTTLAACGDVERNVMCCPAPLQPAIPSAARCRRWPTAWPNISSRGRPPITRSGSRTTKGNEIDATEFKPVEEPIYGPAYLPRKFKTAFALPEDNCVEIYANDLGFLAIVENEPHRRLQRAGRRRHGRDAERPKTFPAVAKRLAFVPPEQVVDVAEAIVKVQRDFGNREDRKVARLKYLIANWGIPAFKAKVEEYLGPVSLRASSARRHRRRRSHRLARAGGRQAVSGSQHRERPHQGRRRPPDQVGVCA